jgi:hypothetical protein
MALGKVSSPSHTRGKRSFRKNATSWKLRFSFSAIRPPRTQRHRKSPLQRRGLRWLLANWLLQIPHCLKHLSSDPKEATGGVCLLFRPPRAFCGSQFPSQCSVLPLLGGGVFGFVARVRLFKAWRSSSGSAMKGLPLPGQPQRLHSMQPMSRARRSGRSRSEGHGVRNQAPTQQIEGTFAVLVVLANDVQKLTWCDVV